MSAPVKPDFFEEESMRGSGRLDPSHSHTTLWSSQEKYIIVHILSRNSLIVEILI